MKLNIKKLLPLFLAACVCLSNTSLTYAKDAEESSELDDEEWEKLKDEMSDIDNDDDWDHETWDEDHRELAWTVFGFTTWNEDSFPNLNFSQFGIYEVLTSNLTDEETEKATNAIKNYRYCTGAYSVKNAKDNLVDNSAYVPLVLISMDTLKASGSGNDVFAMKKYVSTSTMYDSEKSPNSYVENTAKELLRRIIAAEKLYNAYHSDKVNIYQKTNNGLLMMLQSVIYTSSYAKSATPYSAESAEEYFKKSTRKDSYKDYSEFASVSVDKYTPIESAGSYIMDGFGKRIDQE